MTTNDQDDDDDDEEIPTEINYSCKLQLKNNVLDGKFLHQSIFTLPTWAVWGRFEYSYCVYRVRRIWGTNVYVLNTLQQSKNGHIIVNIYHITSLSNIYIKNRTCIHIFFISNTNFGIRAGVAKHFSKSRPKVCLWRFKWEKSTF